MSVLAQTNELGVQHLTIGSSGVSTCFGTFWIR